MASPQVCVLSSCFITPSSATPRHTMFLSVCDIIWRCFHYNQRLLFYALNASSASAPLSYPSAVAQLKSSLSRALVDFFPWAGRAFEQDDGRLALDCNDAGVEFVEAFIDVPFSSLEEDGFQYRPFFKQLAPMGEVLKWSHRDQPLLSVQVTRFAKGEGIVLGVSQSHIVADGHSLWHFMNSWAECSRGLPISVAPLHMRTELGPEKLILPKREEGDRSITEGACLPDFPRKGDLVQAHFHFTGDMMRALKERTAEDGNAPLTSFEALCAHLWKHVTAARAESDAAKTGIFVIANFRSRLVPPLPVEYFGNVLFRNVASTTAGKLERESLRQTAERVHGLIVSMDDKYFKEGLGEIEVKDPIVMTKMVETGTLLLNMTSSPRFPVYEVDFGWGRPMSARPARIRGEGEAALFPGREGGGSVDVCLALSKTAMDILQQDSAFLSF